MRVGRKSGDSGETAPGDGGNGRKIHHQYAQGHDAAHQENPGAASGQRSKFSIFLALFLDLIQRFHTPGRNSGFFRGFLTFRGGFSPKIPLDCLKNSRFAEDVGL